MSFNYKPLWKTLIDKNLSKTDLKKALKMSPATLAKMGKNDNVAMEILNNICNFLECRIEDVIEFEADESKIEKK